MLKIIFFLISYSYSWHPTGHMIVAEIAQQELKKINPQILETANNLLAVMQPFTKNGDYPFVEAATYPDDIKFLNWKSFNNWHFNDYFHDETGKIVELPRNPENIVWAIDQCKYTLYNHKSSQLDDRFGKSFMLIFLIHLIGDIHQPLHNASLVNELHKEGNRGGNDFPIRTSNKSINNLHTFWDMCLLKIPEVHSPLSERHYSFIQQYSQDLVKEFPRQSLEELKEQSVPKWSEEGFKLVVQTVYQGINENDEPSKEYVEKNFPLVKRQLALAGYRLCDTLIKVLSSNGTLEFQLNFDL